MVTEVRDSQWDVELLKPYFDVVLKTFGTDRIMFGSDWPVCLLQSEYSTWVDTITALIKTLTPAEQSAIMGGNAARVYLNPDQK
jgi:L-fuconolactonase